MPNAGRNPGCRCTTGIADLLRKQGARSPTEVAETAVQTADRRQVSGHRHDCTPIRTHQSAASLVSRTYTCWHFRPPGWVPCRYSLMLTVP